MGATHDWFWFLLVEKLARVLLNNHRVRSSKTALMINIYLIIILGRWQTKPKMLIHGELYYEVSGEIMNTTLIIKSNTSLLQLISVLSFCNAHWLLCVYNLTFTIWLLCNTRQGFSYPASARSVIK